MITSTSLSGFGRASPPEVASASPRRSVLRAAAGWLVVLACCLLIGGCSDASSPDRSEAGEETPGEAPVREAVAVDTTAPPEPAFRIRAVTLDARGKPEPGLLAEIRDLGVTHVTLTTFAWQKQFDEPRIELHTDGGWYSETDRGIRTLARRADSLGMDVIIKPHVWIGGYDSEGQSRDEIGFDAEADWQAWEADYRRFVMHYARLAAEVDAAVLVVGTELTRAATERPDFWRGLIRDVRGVYDGELTYAANWYGAYRRIPFWDALDYVGVQAYFPVADRDDPPLEAMLRGWRAHRDSLHALHRETNRPVLFTEMGYRSVAYAAREPWRWPQRDGDAPPAPDVQARCYRAFFATFAPEPWFAGAIVWKWHPRDESNRPIGFTPQNKPAERVLHHWFNGSG